ncbi:MAG: protein kinase [Elusimicrobiaceae bacterium]
MLRNFLRKLLPLFLLPVACAFGAGAGEQSCSMDAHQQLMKEVREQKCEIAVTNPTLVCANEEQKPKFMRMREEFRKRGKEMTKADVDSFWDKAFTECAKKAVARPETGEKCAGLDSAQIIKDVSVTGKKIVAFTMTGKPSDLDLLEPSSCTTPEEWEKLTKDLKPSSTAQTIVKYFEGKKNSVIDEPVLKFLNERYNGKYMQEVINYPYDVLMIIGGAKNNNVQFERAQRPGGHSQGGPMSDEEAMEAIVNASERSAKNAEAAKKTEELESKSDYNAPGVSQSRSGKALLAAATNNSSAGDNTPLQIGGAYSSKSSPRYAAGEDASRSGDLKADNSAYAPAPRSAALVKAGDSHAAIGDFDKAVGFLSKAIDKEGNNPYLYLRRAAYNQKRLNADPEDVNADADKALAGLGQDPRFAEQRAQAHTLKAWALGKQGNREGAVKEIRQMMQELQSAALYAKSRNDKAGFIRLRTQILDNYRRYKDILSDFEFNPELNILPADLDSLSAIPGNTAKKPVSQDSGTLKLYMGLIGLIIFLFLLITVIKVFRHGKRIGMVRDGGSVPSSMHNYEIVKKLGEGGMGEVYLATDRALNRKVAIKKVRTEIGMSTAAKEQLLAEARTVAALHHPNIVDIYTVFKENNDLYLVFEYIAGETLEDMLNRDGKLSLDDAVPIFSGICGALEYAHENGIIHRDLKPSNIMITKKGEIKVMDFGVSRDINGTVSSKTVSGTPAYMAPEQRKGIVRRESDIYSLGICLYEVLTGHVPWELDGVDQGGEYLVAPTQIDSTLPRAIDELLEKSLNEDYHSRIKTAKEFGEILKQIPVA